MKRLTDEQRQLVADNMGIARMVAIRLHRSGGIYSRIDLETAISAAYEGLAVAATAFNPTKGVRFGTYAAWKCRACVQDAVLQAGAITLPSQARQPPDQAWPNVRKCVNAAWACAEAVGDLPKGTNTHEHVTHHAPSVPPGVTGMEEAEEKAYQVRRVRKILGPLDETAKRIVRMRAIEELPHGEIARRLGMSAGRCGVVYEKAIKHLRGDVG